MLWLILPKLDHTRICSLGGAYGLGIIYAKIIYVRWPGELSAALVSDLKTCLGSLGCSCFTI